MKIGSHVGMSGKEMLLGSAKEAVSYGADTFMFYTGAPQNTRRKEIEELNIDPAWEYMKELDGTNTTLLDTRKTTPNMRPFEKYAVKVGGATNHRYNLSDGVLLKDNHIGAAGSITKAIKMAKAYAPFVRKIEIETETLEQVEEAVEAGADIIMLDNISHENMREAMNIIGGKALVEVSGNVTKENIAKITDLGVDFVSSGALTHSAPIMDISLKNLHPVQE